MAKKNRKMVKAKQPLQRRWFAAMSGWGLNLELGSGNNAQGKVKRSIVLPADTKYYYFTVGLSALLHLDFYSHNILSGITQGLTSNQRIGDNIFVEGVSVRVTMDTSSATNITAGGAFRILVVASTVQNTAQWFNLPGLISANIFSSSAAGPLSAYPESRICKVLCDQIFEYPSRPAGQVFLANVDCVLKVPFEFQPTTAVGTAANLYALLIPWTSGGVVNVTTAGAVTAVVTTAFRDS